MEVLRESGNQVEPRADADTSEPPNSAGFRVLGHPQALRILGFWRYLNPFWQPGDGAELQIFPEARARAREMTSVHRSSAALGV